MHLIMVDVDETKYNRISYVLKDKISKIISFQDMDPNKILI